VGRLATMRAGMTGPARLFGVEPQADQMAFVAQQPPDFSAYGRVIAIIAPSSSHTFAPSSGFQGLERLHREKRAAMHLAQQQQDIAGQVSQSAVAAFILAPTPINFPTVERKPLVLPCSVGVIFW
jgi:hypothetical protein